MRHIPEHPLWLGHVGDARDLRSVLDAGIQAMVDLAGNEPPVPVVRELIYCRFPLLDGAGNPPWLLRAAVRCVQELIRAEVPTLIFCSAGMSRTPLIAAAALAGLNIRSTTEMLAEFALLGPLDASPGLLAEIEQALR